MVAKYPALWRRNKNVLSQLLLMLGAWVGSRAFLCRVCMFSLCFHGFSTQIFPSIEICKTDSYFAHVPGQALALGRLDMAYHNSWVPL